MADFENEKIYDDLINKQNEQVVKFIAKELLGSAAKVEIAIVADLVSRIEGFISDILEEDCQSAKFLKVTSLKDARGYYPKEVYFIYGWSNLPDSRYILDYYSDKSWCTVIHY